MGKLKKKLVLTFNYYGLSVSKVTRKQMDLADAHENNPTVVSGLSPAPSAVINQINALNDLVMQRDVLKAQLKGLTTQIHEDSEAITDIIMDQWRPQAQTAIGDDESKAVLLGWGVKGIITGHTPVTVAEAKAEATNPLITGININVHGQHTLDIVNNISGKRAVPPGVSRTDIYGYTGTAGVAIDSFAELISLGGVYLGQANRGKFINHISGNTGKTVYYIAVYIDKKTKKPMAQSPVINAIIN